MKRDNPEHRFQSWTDRFIDRVVLPPMFVTGIDHASQTTDNARARMAGRGIKFGLPDLFVCQYAPLGTPHALWIELKRGSSVSEAQAGVHKAMTAAGQKVWICADMRGVLHALRVAGFDLHGNADNLADEYEARCEVKERAPRKFSSKPRARKPSVSDVRRVAAAGFWRP